MKLKVTLKHEGKKVIVDDTLLDSYIVSKQNPQFQELIKNIVDASGLDSIDTCIINVNFEW